MQSCACSLEPIDRRSRDGILGEEPVGEPGEDLEDGSFSKSVMLYRDASVKVKQIKLLKLGVVRK